MQNTQNTQNITDTTTPTPKQKKLVTPKLICNITGKSRNTTREYLDSRLARLNCTEQTFVDNYANKEAIALLRDGKTVAQVRAITQSTLTTNITPEKLAIILAFNGKQPKIKVVTEKPVATTPAEVKTPQLVTA